MKTQRIEKRKERPSNSSSNSSSPPQKQLNAGREPVVSELLARPDITKVVES